MPSSGEVRKAGDGQRADADTQVRVYPFAPLPGEAASQIVNGFLEATTSSETDFATAKKYLTKGLAAHWNPFQQITVYSGSLVPVADDSTGTSRKDGYTTVDLTGTKSAMVDSKHAYEPARGAFRASFHLVREHNEWRIDGLADGLVLSELDFDRLYHPANMYYFANLGPDADRDGIARRTLVADPVYLRDENDPLLSTPSLVSTVSALLDGPTDWLKPAVTSAAPAGARLYAKAADHGVTLDDSQHLRVRLDRSADHMTAQRCVLLGAQLFATVQAQASAQLSAVQVQRADGSRLCSALSGDMQSYGPENLAGNATRQYYISADHKLLALPETGLTAAPVPGPFGADKAGLTSVAIRRDELVAAGVRASGRELVVGSLTIPGQFASPLVRSEATDSKNGLSAPSWDGLGDLWVADRDPQNSQLLMLRGGAGQPHEVSVPGLLGRVESLRVSSDGVRIALIVRQGGDSTLQLGRIQRGTAKDPDAFTVTGLRTLTPVGEKVTSVSWAGVSRLVVLGSETGGVQQIQYMNTDGSAAPALEGINEAASVAASEIEDKPLLASYNGRVYRLPAEANWKQVNPKGSGPVYPG